MQENFKTIFLHFSYKGGIKIDCIIFSGGAAKNRGNGKNK